MTKRTGFKNRATREVACNGKDKLTPQLARDVAKRMPGTSAYHCTHCKGWHVGHAQDHRTTLRHKRPRFYDNDGSDDT